MRHGKLQIGDRVEVDSWAWRPGNAEQSIQVGRWRRVSVVGVTDKGFEWRTLPDDLGKRTRGKRLFEDKGQTWRPGDQRETQGYYGFDQGRVLLVGEAPNRWMEEHEEWGHCLAREDLAGLCGVGFPDPFIRLFARTNVLSRWPGRQGKGSAFPMAQAKPAAQDLLDRVIRSKRFDHIVLLGRRVAEAAGLPRGDEWFSSRWVPKGERVQVRARVSLAPHPSKLSRWWNQASNVVEARRFWSALADEAAKNAGLRRIGPVQRLTVAATVRSEARL